MCAPFYHALPALTLLSSFTRSRIPHPGQPNCRRKFTQGPSRGGGRYPPSADTSLCCCVKPPSPPASAPPPWLLLLCIHAHTPPLLCRANAESLVYRTQQTPSVDRNLPHCLLLPLSAPTPDGRLCLKWRRIINMGAIYL